MAAHGWFEAEHRTEAFVINPFYITLLVVVLIITLGWWITEIRGGDDPSRARHRALLMLGSFFKVLPIILFFATTIFIVSFEFDLVFGAEGFLYIFAFIVITIAIPKYTAERLLQTRRDKIARDLADETLKIDDKAKPDVKHDFILYLRPFYTTGTIMASAVSVDSDDLFAPEYFSYEIEEQVRRAVEPYGPMIALGRPGETIGSGRIAVNDKDWQKTIGKMMRFARWIICLPSSHEGTYWEVVQLFDQNFYEKTLFIMPPTHGTESLVKYKGRLKSILRKRLKARPPELEQTTDVREDWDVLVQMLEDCGIAFPQYDPKGMVFFATPQGAIIVADTVDLAAEGYWDAVIKNARLLKEI